MTCNNPESCTCTGFNMKFCKWYGPEKKKKQPHPKQRKKIKPVSDKNKANLESYKLLRIAFLKRNPACFFSLNGCTRTATEIHHVKRRGKYLLETETWRQTCSNCHHYIETHPQESREKGWINTTEK